MVGVKGLHGLLPVGPGVHTRKGIGTGLFHARLSTVFYSVLRSMLHPVWRSV